MKLFVSVLLFLFSVCSATAQSNYWQQQVNYQIGVKLDDKENTLDGFVKIQYINNSPDTLHYIWFHVWANAYKNDKTAFSDQLLENGNTDFYFSDNEKRGYINRLDFKVNGSVVRMEDHPQHQDIIKIVLTQPLAPGSSCSIETPFHEKLPYNFSRGGYKGHAYQITQWYPKPAVYDRKGWHPMPYLGQGEFYSEFGNYEVQVTVPAEYIVAATGELQTETKAAAAKTLVYKQENIHDFAWFADKRFFVNKDTLQLPSGRVIHVFAYSLRPGKKEYVWQPAVKYIKRAVLSRSRLLGEYPYNTVSVVQADADYAWGMEYPTITAISGVRTTKELEGLLEHEVGHNWLYGIMASNERDHAWMDEGMNTYYGTRYWNAEVDINIREKVKDKFFKDRMPVNMNYFTLYNVLASKKDQPIETASEKLSALNYDMMAYHKPSRWMKYMESVLGRPVFDSAMHEYYRRWQFKHPYPEDFKKVMEEVSGRNLDIEFDALSKKGNLPFKPVKRETKFVSFFSFKETGKYKYIFAGPVAGFNVYDKLMLGAAIHNYTLPEEKFQFLIAPVYGIGSKSLNGLGRLSYSWLPCNDGKKIELSLAASTFNGDEFTDSTGKKNYLRFAKIVPSVKITFANKDPRSEVIKYLQWKTFFIAEQGLRFTRDTINGADIITYPTTNRYVNQLRFVLENKRVLYPFSVLLQADQGKSFTRLAFTGNYFFNYAKGGGMNVRLFAGKFFYLGEKTFRKQFETDIYQLNLTGANGYEDYTYSNYFLGRNEFDGFSSQQLMQRDGFFKVRTDLLSSKIGKTDNWLAAANFTTDVPDKFNPLKVLPFNLPLKFFVDIGTYAEAWQKDAPTGKLLYDAGLQLSLAKGVINIYVPLFYSKVYGDYFKSTITEKRFLKNIAFTIDIQNITLKKLIPQLVY